MQKQPSCVLWHKIYWLKLGLILRSTCSTFSHKQKARNTLHNLRPNINHVPNISQEHDKRRLADCRIGSKLVQSVHVFSLSRIWGLPVCFQHNNKPIQEDLTFLPSLLHSQILNTGCFCLTFHSAGNSLFQKGCVSRHRSHWCCISVVDTWKTFESWIGVTELWLQSGTIVRKGHVRDQVCLGLCVFVEHLGHTPHTLASSHLTTVWDNGSVFRNLYIHCQWT